MVPTTARVNEADLRVLAVAVLANPTEAVSLLRAYAEQLRHPVDESRLLSQVQLYVHVTDHPADEVGVARVEAGHGVRAAQPITDAWVRSWLGPRATFTIKPVLMPQVLAPVDAWEIPARHREAVHLITPTDIFPYASNTTRAKQIDHTAEYDPHGPPGQSRVGNYGPMVTFHHRLKTHGHWDVKQPFPGIYLWRDPLGATYLVDHTGTRRLAQTLRPTAGSIHRH